MGYEVAGYGRGGILAHVPVFPAPHIPPPQPQQQSCAGCLCQGVHCNEVPDPRPCRLLVSGDAEDGIIIALAPPQTQQNGSGRGAYIHGKECLFSQTDLYCYRFIKLYVCPSRMCRLSGHNGVAASSLINVWSEKPTSKWLPTSSLFHKAIYMPFVCVVCRFVVWFVQFCFIKPKVHFYVTNYNSTTYIYKYHESRPNSFHVFHKGQLIAPNYIPSAEM